MPSHNTMTLCCPILLAGGMNSVTICRSNRVLNIDNSGGPPVVGGRAFLHSPFQRVLGVSLVETYHAFACGSAMYTRPGAPGFTLFFTKQSLICFRSSRLTPHCLLGRVLISIRYSTSSLPTRSMPGT